MGIDCPLKKVMEGQEGSQARKYSSVSPAAEGIAQQSQRRHMLAEWNTAADVSSARVVTMAKFAC